jgi:hypothetical protein
MMLAPGVDADDQRFILLTAGHSAIGVGLNHRGSDRDFNL